MLALVWIAGPLSGVLVQPYVGMKSDNCRIKWGKRRPFIVGGAAATIVSLMVLAWAAEIMGGFLSIFGANPEGAFVKNSIMFFAVLFVYVLDFAINVSKYRFRHLTVPFHILTTTQSKLEFEHISSTSPQHISKKLRMPG